MKKLLFKSGAAYITKEDGFIHWSKIKIDVENMYNQYFEGAETSVIKKLEANIRKSRKELDEILKQLDNFKDSIQQKDLF